MSAIEARMKEIQGQITSLTMEYSSICKRCKLCRMFKPNDDFFITRLKRLGTVCIQCREPVKTPIQMPVAIQAHIPVVTSVITPVAIQEPIPVVTSAPIPVVTSVVETPPDILQNIDERETRRAKRARKKERKERRKEMRRQNGL